MTSGTFTGPGTGSGERPAWSGLSVAGLTAAVSGLSVFVNAYAVHSAPSPVAYTTAKNTVAFFLLAGFTAVAARHRRAAWASALLRRWRHPGGPTTGAWPGGADRAVVPFFPPPDGGSDRASSPGRLRPGRLRPGQLRPGQWLGLAYVGVIGGGLAFFLFFQGLAHTQAAPAAFFHGTQVAWVALLGVPLLAERITAWNVGAVVLLVAGQVALAGGTGHLAPGPGTAMVLGATLLWAVEVVVTRRLLSGLAPATVALVRMGVGSVVLGCSLAVLGTLRPLLALGAGQVAWVALTGLLLALYVGTWTTALARARAVDASSVLVAGALVTATLQAAAGGTLPVSAGLGLVLLGAGTMVAARAFRRRAAV